MVFYFILIQYDAGDEEDDDEEPQTTIGFSVFS